MRIPFAVGAKAAKPQAQVICLHGEGSFGQNAMELDTAVRHKLPLLCIISLNGGWTDDQTSEIPKRALPRFDAKPTHRRFFGNSTRGGIVLKTGGEPADLPPDYGAAAKYGITRSANRRIEASASSSGTMLKLTCSEACS
ncbi:MAG: hypothetical protein JOZ11_02335 [Alphaproteobacteria bacterium]|nr:hypothetical protein [Alphaproteobacteria bacterium]